MLLFRRTFEEELQKSNKNDGERYKTVKIVYLVLLKWLKTNLIRNHSSVVEIDKYFSNMQVTNFLFKENGTFNCKFRVNFKIYGLIFVTDQILQFYS